MREPAMANVVDGSSASLPPTAAAAPPPPQIVILALAYLVRLDGVYGRDETGRRAGSSCILELTNELDWRQTF